MNIPVAPLDRLIRRAKAERVSEKAAYELGAILEELGLEIAGRAQEL
ncbi:MAG: histone, partial [Candidatus Ranarchaeia archaeon]